MDGFSPALCGIDAAYILTARDRGLGQLTEQLWSSIVGRGGYLGHTISLGVKMTLACELWAVVVISRSPV
jgi:hypothetical protein